MNPDLLDSTKHNIPLRFTQSLKTIFWIIFEGGFFKATLEKKARHKTKYNLYKHPNGTRLDYNIRLEKKPLDNGITSKLYF